MICKSLVSSTMIYGTEKWSLKKKIQICYLQKWISQDFLQDGQNLIKSKTNKQKQQTSVLNFIKSREL